MLHSNIILLRACLNCQLIVLHHVEFSYLGSSCKHSESWNNKRLGNMLENNFFYKLAPFGSHIWKVSSVPISSLTMMVHRNSSKVQRPGTGWQSSTFANQLKSNLYGILSDPRGAPVFYKLILFDGIKILPTCPPYNPYIFSSLFCSAHMGYCGYWSHHCRFWTKGKGWILG